MKNIVLMAGSYYPNCSAVGRCIGNIADVLEKKNRVTVIAQITEISDLLLDHRGAQTIIRIKTKDLYRDMYCREQIKRGKRKFAIAHKYYQVKRVMGAIFSGNSIVKKNMNAYLEALNSLETEPDIIIPTCLPFETVVAALMYKNKHRKCKIVPVVFDMFAVSGRLQRFSWNQKLKMKKNQDLEKKMFEESERVLHMPSWTSYIDSWFSAYKYKCCEIEHPLLVCPNVQNVVENGGCCNDVARGETRSINKKSLVFAGGLIRNYVEADFLIELLNCEEVQKICKMRFFSAGNACDIIEKAQIDIVNHGWVAHDELLRALDAANVLVSIAEKAGKQISSKIFEYMSLGKPILHIYYNDSDVNLRYLQRYPLALCIKADMKCLKKNQKILYEWIEKNYMSRVSFQYIAQIFNEMTPECIAEKIME